MHFVIQRGNSGHFTRTSLLDRILFGSKRMGFDFFQTDKRIFGQLKGFNQPRLGLESGQKASAVASFVIHTDWNLSNQTHEKMHSKCCEICTSHFEIDPVCEWNSWNSSKFMEFQQFDMIWIRFGASHWTGIQKAFGVHCTRHCVSNWQLLSVVTRYFIGNGWIEHGCFRAAFVSFHFNELLFHTRWTGAINE